MFKILEYVAIGIPLCAALVIRLRGEAFPRATRWFFLSSLCAVAITALLLFVVNGKFACVLVGGKQNCLFDGAALVTLCLLCVLLVIRMWSDERARAPGVYVWFLLLVVGWAGMGLAENLLVFVLALNIFGYALYRLLKHYDIMWGIFVPWGGRNPPQK